jgi:hypothetical protein
MSHTLIIKLSKDHISLQITNCPRTFRLFTEKGKLTVLKLEGEKLIDKYEPSLNISSPDELLKAFEEKPEYYYSKITGENTVIDELLIVEEV